MRPALNVSVFVLASLAVSACGGSVSTTSSHGQTSVLPGTSPVQAYTQVARQIKGCWFKPSDPVLPRHVFRAEAPADGPQAGQTVVVIYDRAPDGRLGLKAYTVSFLKRGKGTVVTTQNHKLPYALAQKLTGDVGYWVQGGVTCEGPPGADAPTRGSFGGPQPRVSTPPPS